jgi:oligosaccharide reducing-end xylanase
MNMRRTTIFHHRHGTRVVVLTALTVIFVFRESVCGSAHRDSSENLSEHVGAYESGKYPDLFSELLGKSEEDVRTKVTASFHQLFYGDDTNQRVYYPVGTDKAYIEDINNGDVRSEGMSYGMMIAVQWDKREEFDRLWTWAKTFMQHKEGPRKGYFAWHCRTDGGIIDSNAASDGEEWFATSLFLASARWGVDRYRVEAQAILDAMLSKTASSNAKGVVTNMFDRIAKQVVFVPEGNADDFTDPSYHLPHFYEVWARCADKNNQFWRDAAATSREFLWKTTNAATGLAPDYARFDGSAYDPWGGHKDMFQFDAWRVGANIAMDYLWFAREQREMVQSNRLLRFFYAKGVHAYGNVFTLDGTTSYGDHSTGLVATNAVACLASTLEYRKDFVEELWNAPIPSGRYRYYDGMLYMLALLQVSGNFRVYQCAG